MHSFFYELKVFFPLHKLGDKVIYVSVKRP